MPDRITYCRQLVKVPSSTSVCSAAIVLAMSYMSLEKTLIRSSYCRPLIQTPLNLPQAWNRPELSTESLWSSSLWLAAILLAMSHRPLIKMHALGQDTCKNNLLRHVVKIQSSISFCSAGTLLAMPYRSLVKMPVRITY
eukprot:gene13942-19878_t